MSLRKEKESDFQTKEAFLFNKVDSIDYTYRMETNSHFM